MPAHDPAFLPQAIIRKKRDGHKLSRDELRHFVNGAVDGTVAQESIGAFTMAVYLKGMSRQERIDYALAMRDSGQVIDWSVIGLEGPTIIDKHSSGGVGDEKVSLIVTPLVAACGIHMPMISGRGLGHTGGEIDLLDGIPGYNTTPSIAAFMSVVKDIGCAIIAPTKDLAPADRPIFYARDVCATVESIPLITGSIMSKKLAAGINGLVMTVPFGSGAFMRSEADAQELASSMIDVAEEAGVPMSALISDLTQPLGDSVGSNLQVLEVIRFLDGALREPRLLETVLALAASILTMGGLADNLDEARKLSLEKLNDHSALERFSRMVAALGGPTDLVARPENHLKRARFIKPVFFASTSGYIERVDCYALGSGLVAMGAGRTRPGDAIDHTIGIASMASVGDRVDRERPLCVLHAPSEEAWEDCATAIRNAYQLSDMRPNAEPVIRATLGFGGEKPPV